MNDQHHPLDSQDPKGPMKLTGWRVVCLALLASAWGLTELIGGPTAWLVGVAMLLLATGRGLLNRAGSSTAMAAVAVLFKSVNAAPFFCQLAGIALLGIAFDLTATLLWRADRRPIVRASLTGVSSAYLSCFLFAASMVWIFEFRNWVGGGLARVGEYTLYSGSRGALFSLIAVPLGLWMGAVLTRQAAVHPRTVLRAAGTACLALWVVGRFAG